MKKSTFSFFLAMICLCSSQLLAQDVAQHINEHLIQQVENKSLTSQDLEWIITAEHTSRTSNVHHVYFSQAINGLEIEGTASGIHISPNGKVLSVNSKFVSNTQSKMQGNATPALSATTAAEMAAAQLGYRLQESISVVEQARGASQVQVLSNGGVSISDIPARLMYVHTDEGELKLVWDIAIQALDHANWWNARLDATSGQILDKNDWMVTCSMEHDHSHEVVLDYNKNLFDIPNYKETTAATAGCSDCYEVVPYPLESAYFGARVVEVNPADPTASPFGWHDTNGAVGAEFTDTRGNNANAFEAGNNNGYRPDGGPGLDFQGYPYAEVWEQNVNEYEDAAITNVFYWTNIIHDVLYPYGFDEISGNFQENNYGNGGLGSDSVDAFVQLTLDCNARFGTPPDGQNPNMLNYVCPNGFQDGAFDNLVNIHEIGHGVSNRLTGGPAQDGCLQNTEQMGEGWSDFLGVLLTIQPGDVGTDARAVGTYLFGQGPNGNGIRNFPYSTDLAVNPETYGNVGGVSIPHGVGSIWSTMLWEVTWALIDQYGFDPDFYDFQGDVNLDAGNVQAMAIVLEGMKLQPCGPGFVDGRDAIFAADQALYGGANECLLWDAFAKRGLGVSADQGSTNSVADGTPAFDTPSAVADLIPSRDEICSNEPPVTLGGGFPAGGVYSGSGVTDDGNGTTFTFDAAAAGTGIVTITYDVPVTSCAPASSDTADIEVVGVGAGPTATGADGYCPGDDVTVSATPNDPANEIRWYDAQLGGNLLFEGEDYTFTPSGNVAVYAQEVPPGPTSRLVISEITLQTPDRLEVQNSGDAFDYTGYAVAVSADPYPDINAINTNIQILGNMGANSAVAYSDDSGAGDYWGSNIFWDEGGTGWIIIVDPAGNVVDSVFWNFSASQIAGLNVTINGFNITAADLDWQGDGFSVSVACNQSYRRADDLNMASDWPGTCETSDYGVANDITFGFPGCLNERTEVLVTVETEIPTLACPADLTETVDAGQDFVIPDYTVGATVVDNCTVDPALAQSPAPGTTVGTGDTTITITATDEAGNVADCTFVLTVDEILGLEDALLDNQIVLYPNPTSGQLTLVNNSSETLNSATVLDVNGRIIETIDLRNTGVNTPLSIEGAATGIYFVQITTESTTIVKRIVKQ